VINSKTLSTVELGHSLPKNPDRAQLFQTQFETEIGRHRSSHNSTSFRERNCKSWSITLHSVNLHGFVSIDCNGFPLVAYGSGTAPDHMKHKFRSNAAKRYSIERKNAKKLLKMARNFINSGEEFHWNLLTYNCLHFASDQLRIAGHDNSQYQTMLSYSPLHTVNAYNNQLKPINPEYLKAVNHHLEVGTLPKKFNVPLHTKNNHPNYSLALMVLYFSIVLLRSYQVRNKFFNLKNRVLRQKKLKQKLEKQKSKTIDLGKSIYHIKQINILRDQVRGMSIQFGSISIHLAASYLSLRTLIPQFFTLNAALLKSAEIGIASAIMLNWSSRPIAALLKVKPKEDLKSAFQGIDLNNPLDVMNVSGFLNRKHKSIHDVIEYSAEIDAEKILAQLDDKFS